MDVLEQFVISFKAEVRVESPDNFASKLHVRDLIFADRNEIGIVNDDIGRLQDRVAKEAVGAEVAIFQILDLLFVSGNALEPRKRRDHRKEQIQLGVLQHARLDEQG